MLEQNKFARTLGSPQKTRKQSQNQDGNFD